MQWRLYVYCFWFGNDLCMFALSLIFKINNFELSVIIYSNHVIFYKPEQQFNFLIVHLSCIYCFIIPVREKSCLWGSHQVGLRMIGAWFYRGDRCISVLYTGHVKEPDCLFEVRARHTTLDMSVSNVSMSLFYGLSLSLSLWSDHSVSTLVEDASASLWLQYYVKRL